jgi:hypothetical protein
VCQKSIIVFISQKLSKISQKFLYTGQQLKTIINNYSLQIGVPIGFISQKLSKINQKFVYMQKKVYLCSPKGAKVANVGLKRLQTF